VPNKVAEKRMHHHCAGFQNESLRIRIDRFLSRELKTLS